LPSVNYLPLISGKSQARNNEIQAVSVRVISAPDSWNSFLIGGKRMAYSQYNKRRFEGEKPVKEGETYEIDVEATGAKGDGIGKVKGFVVIIPNAKPGQKVKVRIDAVRGKVAFGTMVGEAAAAAKSTEAEGTEGEEQEEGAEAESEEESEGEAQEEGTEAESEDESEEIEEISEENEEE